MKKVEKLPPFKGVLGKLYGNYTITNTQCTDFKEGEIVFYKPSSKSSKSKNLVVVGIDKSLNKVLCLSNFTKEEFLTFELMFQMGELSQEEYDAITKPKLFAPNSLLQLKYASLMKYKNKKNSFNICLN